MGDFNSIKGCIAANSYASVEQADDYFDLEFGADDWFGLEDAAKEKLLVTATRMIDKLKPIYGKLSSDQALNFPMKTYGGTLGDGFEQAKQACIQQAYYLLHSHEMLNEAVQGNIIGLKADSFGKTSKTVNGYNAFAKFSPGILSILSSYIDLSLRVSR